MRGGSLNRFKLETYWSPIDPSKVLTSLAPSCFTHSISCCRCVLLAPLLQRMPCVPFPQRLCLLSNFAFSGLFNIAAYKYCSFSATSGYLRSRRLYGRPFALAALFGCSFNPLSPFRYCASVGCSQRQSRPLRRRFASRFPLRVHFRTSVLGPTRSLGAVYH